MTVSRNGSPNPHKFRTLAVSAVQELTAEITRITLTGDMDGFTSSGPTDHVQVFFPNSEGAMNAPRLRQDGGIIWEEGVKYTFRNYTPLNWTAESLDLDFVIHGEDAPGSQWAANARVGEEVVVGGPRASKDVPVGADRWFLLADYSGLPALGRWLSQAPAGQEVRALVFGGETLVDYPLPVDANVEWVLGEFDPEPYVRDLEVSQGRAYIWAAGEATGLVELRRYLRHELGLPKEQFDLDGYWRRGVAGVDHQSSIDRTSPGD